MNEMPLGVSVKVIQDLDRVAIQEYGVPSIALMENAGRSVAFEVVGALLKMDGIRVVVVCGRGNNAGDGFVVARHLVNAGCDVTIILIGKESHLKNDAAVNFQILRKCGCSIYTTETVDDIISQILSDADVIVDAIFGVGLNRNIESPYKDFIEAVNSQQGQIVSVDIPSGLNGDTGEIYDVCINADKTVTFSFTKKGFYLGAGPEKAGEVTVVDIGIPKVLYGKVNGG